MTVTRMTLGIYRAFALPWLVAMRSTCWVVVVVVSLTGVILALTAAVAISSKAWMGYIALMCVATFFCWVLVVPRVSLLHRAAYLLRLPRIDREIRRSALLYACVSVSVPMLLMPAHALVAGLALALAVAVSVGMLLLPRYLTLFGWVFWVVVLLMPGKAWTSNWSELDFLVGGGLALVLLAVGSVWGWRWLASPNGADTQYWRMPMALQLARPAGGWINTQASMAQGRGNGWHGWWKVAVDLRRIGPQHPIQSLRIAVAGGYLPQLVSLRTVLILVVALALPIALVYVNTSLAAPQFAVVAAEYMSVAVVFGARSSVERRWAEPADELSLLSLLPGFGGTRGARRALMHTLFGQPTRQLGGLLLLMWVAIAWGRLGYGWVLVTLLAQLGWFGLLAVLLPAIVAGWPWPGRVQGLLTIAMAALVATSFWLLGLGVATPGPWYAIGIGSVVLALALLWLGSQSWQALLRQPHVFLVH